MQASKLCAGSQAENGILAIQSLDLNRLKNRLQQDAPRGKGLTPAQAGEAEKWYRRFLILSVKHPDVTLVPTTEVDEFWHSHVLDMQRYRDDTQRIFGEVLFHTPLFGDEDLSAEFAQTQALFTQEFGEAPAAEDGYQAASCKRAATCQN